MYEDLALKQKLFFELYGRRLLQAETACTEDELRFGVMQKIIEEIPGIIRKSNQMVCNGCGNQEPSKFAFHSCLKCGKNKCYYCRSCISLRKISMCTPLYIWKDCIDFPLPPENLTEDLLDWSGKLTYGQQHASQIMIQQIERKQDALVYAVAGAGKTEMMFQPIAYALSKGKRVCFAAPRTDVILELAPRLQKVFPKIPIGIYYGGSEYRNPHASFILTTTHQLMRFEKYFDVCILDESDAFPYKIEHTLQFSLMKSLKPSHSLIYCTATPEPKLLRKLQKEKIPIVFISRRFHGRPLEIPEFYWVGNWKKQLTNQCLPTKLRIKIKKALSKKRQVFLFVPTIDIAKQTEQILRKYSIHAVSVHAEDKNRKSKVEAFRKKEFDVIVTTTILERGVTVPYTDVFVLGSEADIFDCSALIQICGRAGRYFDDTDAHIYFFHKGITKAMRQAKKRIIQMNQKGEKEK